MPSSGHKKCGWKAENYFDDPQVIALCHAIEANDLPEIDRLVAAGANVNAKGKGKMTPLLWAYPDNKLARFQKMLEHGADPNVITESDFNTCGALQSGTAVTHMACQTSFPGYFEAVFENGGNPNLVTQSVVERGYTPLFLVMTGLAPDMLKQIQVLIDKGADLNYHCDGIESMPAMYAADSGHFNIALLLVKSGANYRLYPDNQTAKLIHSVVGSAKFLAHGPPQRTADYEELVAWLESHGESAEQARADLERWHSWSPDEYRYNMNAEIAARKAREAREKEVAEQEKAGVQHEPSAGNP